MRLPVYRVLLFSLIVSFVLVALIGIVAIVVPGLVPQTGRVLGSIAMFGGFSLLGLACAAGLERERAKPVMFIGLTASLAGFILGMLWNWLPIAAFSAENELLGRAAAIATIIATWAAFIGSLLLKSTARPASRRMARTGIVLVTLLAIYFVIVVILNLHDWWWLRGMGSGLTVLGWMIWASLIVRFHPRGRRARQFVTATFGIGTLFALILLAVIWFDRFFEGERVTGVLIILTASSTLISVCLTLIERYRGRSAHETLGPGSAAAITVHVQCPRCQTALALKQGWSDCAGCKLRIRIELEEPRCACGYPLHMLAADVCPECGAAV